MAAPSLLSPNTGNLRVGKGILSWKQTGFSEYRDMGEVREFEIAMSVETLPHFTQRSGVREKDLEIILTRGGTVRVLMEEWTPANLALMLMGNVDEGAAGGPEVEIYAEDATEGQLRFVGTNDQGPKLTATLDLVRFIPNNAIQFLSEEFGALELSGEMLKSQVTSSFGKVKWTNIGSET
jgi:hypothetical protein